MMSQGQSGAGYRNPADGPFKGGSGHPMGPSGSFPPQQYPPGTMTNGVQQAFTNGPAVSQSYNRQPQFPPNQSQPSPQKGAGPYGGQTPLHQQPISRPSPPPTQQQGTAQGHPMQPQQHYQHGPGGAPPQQQPRPGGPPQQPGMRPGGPPQQPGMRPGGPSQQAGMRPGGPPQQPGMRPGGPPQQAGMRPGGPPQQPGMRPGGPTQQPGMRPSGPPQQQGMRPGGPPQQQGMRPGGPPQPHMQGPPGLPTHQQPTGGLPQHFPQHGQPQSSLPPQPHHPPQQQHPHQQMNQQMQNLNISSSQPQQQMGWPQPGQDRFQRPPTSSSAQMMPPMPGPPTSLHGGPSPSSLSVNPPSSMSMGMMSPAPGMSMGGHPPTSQPGGQPMMPPTSFPGPQPGYPGGAPMGGMPPPPGHRPQQPMGGGMPGPMGNPMQQQKRIDPDQMPSPIQVMKDDQDTHKDQPFLTDTRDRIPPLVTSKFVIKDNGNCSPRYMRSTMYNVPCNKDLLQASDIPLAAIITPFAEIPTSEGYLPIVNLGATGPVRCNRCKAYINPFVQFIDGGRKFVCNICAYSTEVPQEYFCHLDHQGLRVDRYERPELCLGSYEFVATTDYCKDQKFPGPPAYIFMIDVSYQSLQCGMVRMLMKELNELLDHLPKEFSSEQSEVRVGFVTYSNHLHFYNIKGSLAQPQMMVVSDVEDVFVPILDGFLVNVEEARSVIDSLLEQIPVLFGETRETETVLGPVVQAGVDALKSAGISGKLFIFHSSLPIAEAPGKLKNREDRKLLATDKEKTILGPQSTFYDKLAKDCVEAGVSVDLFLFPNAYVDLATIGAVASQTGGDIYRYSYFKESTHGIQFREDLKRTIESNVGFDAVMRLRCSTGLRPTDFMGSFYMSNTTDVELASISPGKAIAIEIKHDDKLTENSSAYLQCALLYTSIGGQRRLRIHNLALNTCSQLSELFRCCEMDSFVNFVSKKAIRAALTTPPKDIREQLVNQCAQVLACYRRNCASPSSAGQLILPECMKLLPLYVNCVLKSDAIAGGSEMSSDDRSWLMRRVISMDQDASVPYFYPRLFVVHDTDLEATGIPEQIRCSIERMSDNGMYLLDNGISLLMWVGLQVDPSLLQQVFGVPTIGQVDIEMTSLPELENPLSSRITDIISSIRAERKNYLKLTIVRQRDKLEPWFKHFLVEDKGMVSTSPSYVDFLCLMHKEIRNLLN